MVRRLVHFEEGIRLLEHDLPATELAPGEPLSLRLYWEGDGATEESYHVFVHILGPDGQVYGQDDALPQQGWMPTMRWQAGTVILDDHRVTVAEDASPGEYAIALGLYDLETMRRLPVSDAEGKSLPHDRVLIEGLRVTLDD